MYLDWLKIWNASQLWILKIFYLTALLPFSFIFAVALVRRCYLLISEGELVKADEAARESRRTKQDRYEEMRRRKDEEREAQELKLVG